MTPKNPSIEILQRPRRNRANAGIRALVRETRLSVHDLIMPCFIVEGKNKLVPVKSMPGIDKLSIDLLIGEVKELAQLGIPAMALFPRLSDKLKDKRAKESVNPNGLLQQAVAAIKKTEPAMVVITDVAMDPYSSDGHDGLLDNGEILNDETLPILAAMAVSQAKAGADMVAPSDMMDGRIGYIRRALDAAGYHDVGILSYAAKYASAFYGPFRDALGSAPRAGDKKTYQMDPANVREATHEVQLDVEEGADIVMVKPGLAYMDVIAAIRSNVNVPIAAYNVSGEYAMVKAAAQQGWIEEDPVVMEMLTSFKRAGADMILTYFAKQAAKLLT